MPLARETHGMPLLQARRAGIAMLVDPCLIRVLTTRSASVRTGAVLRGRSRHIEKLEPHDWRRCPYDWRRCPRDRTVGICFLVSLRLSGVGSTWPRGYVELLRSFNWVLLSFVYLHLVLIKVCPGADGYGGKKALWRLYQKDVAVVLWPLDLGAWPSPDAEDMVRFFASTA